MTFQFNRFSNACHFFRQPSVPLWMWRCHTHSQTAVHSRVFFSTLNLFFLEFSAPSPATCIWFCGKIAMMHRSIRQKCHAVLQTLDLVQCCSRNQLVGYSETVTPELELYCSFRKKCTKKYIYKKKTRLKNSFKKIDGILTFYLSNPTD